ncbi:MAG: pantetheine-phosphate adenylyltransferase [Rectinemataceae bacterium]|nr:pantetheine-phosphate adenylyltransferase [Spirochaetaceae bacterium]
MVDAVFAGSFDPPTMGHQDIIQTASRMFRTLHVVIAVNPLKKSMFTLEERLAMIRAMVQDRSNVRVTVWEGLVTDYAHQHGCEALVRGVRSAADLPYEASMAGMNRRLDPDIVTVFFLCRPEHEDISSSLVRDIIQHGRLPQGIVPPAVEEILHRCMESRGNPLS